MRYTEKQETILSNALYLDTGEDDYTKVIDVLNTEFRSFGEGIVGFMQLTEGKPIDNPIKLLKERCENAGIDISVIGSVNSIKSWFSGGPRPKKSEESRKKIFAIAFALNLTTLQTAELFHKVYLDRAFNQRNYKELIYYYCIEKNYSFNHAEKLISMVNIEKSAYNDKTVYTTILTNEAMKSKKDDELINYIHTHGHNLSINNESAKKALRDLKKEAFVYAQEYAEKRMTKEEMHGKDITSDSFLYYCLTNQSITGEKGTITIPFKNTIFPKEIKNNFPQVKSLSEKVDSYEELRKVIILLFSYIFWNQLKESPEIDVFTDYIEQLNNLLLSANMSELYYGNSYDWLFMYCTFQDQHEPLDTFYGILSTVLDEEV